MLSNFSDLLSFTPLFGLFIPFIVRFIERQNKLQRSRYLIDLIKTREELKELLGEKTEGDATSLVVTRRLEELIEEIEAEIFAPPKEYRIKGYIILITIEIVTMISGVYFGILVFMNRIIRGKSYENNLPFLEGIFSNPVSRVMMLMLFVTTSIFLSLQVAKKWESAVSRRNRYKFNLFILLVFNIFFCAITLVSSFFLYLLDFFNPWF